jgi:diguanylate cyclase (GGDEF)-like protein
MDLWATCCLSAGDFVAFSLDALYMSTPPFSPTVFLEAVAQATAEADPKLIFLIEGDARSAHDLTSQLSYFGYIAQAFTQTDTLLLETQRQQPKAILMDMAFAEQHTGQDGLLSDLRATQKDLPIVFLSARADLSSRLRAVRIGCDAYFLKPVDIGALVDKLDALTSHPPLAPYRILIVEDSETMAAYYAAVLRRAEMIVEVVTDPLQVMQPLIEFRPDLILMDMYMPGCTGLELAKVLRQQEAYVTIPIIFISVETDFEKQKVALSLGADAFIVKPILPEQLISTVESRAERSRVVRAFMVRDSLTGLFNHTATTSQLTVEVARAKRQNQSLAFAMLDIDHFKSVNDTYGHPVGDRVLKSLARLLQQRLRKTDIVGRYGGEEFAVILPNTSAEAALRVMNEIREAFALVRHQPAESDEFLVTFSCGIAAFPDYADATQITVEADKALYQAKRGGRNQVCLAE